MLTEQASKNKTNAGSTVTSCWFCTARALHVLQAVKASVGLSGARSHGRGAWRETRAHVKTHGFGI